MKAEKKRCLECGAKMLGGMLPGWWMCTRCAFFLDVQEFGDFGVWQYGKQARTEKVLVPEGCLLVVDL